MRILIICTNYNTYDKEEQYFQSIYHAAELANVTVDVLVGDNSNPVQERKYEYDNVQVKSFVTNDNLGYFGGIIYAIRVSEVSLAEYNYVILSNVDLCVSKDFFQVLINNEYSEKIGCIAPAIYSMDTQNDRNPKMINRPSKKRLEVIRIMYKYPLLFTIYKNYFRRSKKNADQIMSMKIYAPHGSFMIFTPCAFPFLSKMNFGAFMFCEEIFIGENMNKHGLDVYYDPSLKVIDSDHESTKKIKKKRLYKWNVDALSYILKEFY